MTLTKPPLTRQLGKSGIEISSLAWGMWRFAGLEMSAARAAIDAAFEAGITLFDTADIYECSQNHLTYVRGWCSQPRAG
jgi:aryl-alcohol dehydrogenase-like predicted oxidoreductase